LQPVLQQEAEIVGVEGIAAEPDAERVEDRVARGIFVRNVGEAMGEQKVGPDRHGPYAGSQVKISPDRRSG
jgi:hypothetical protein